MSLASCMQNAIETRMTEVTVESKEHRKVNDELDELIEEIKSQGGEELASLLRDLDNKFTERLLMHRRAMYWTGFEDGRKMERGELLR